MKKLLLLLSIPLFISSGHINTTSKPPPIIKLHDTTPLPTTSYDSTNTLIDRQSSIEMFLFWKNYHHPEDGFEEIARCWNGGPRGLKNKRTEKYWVKVQKQLNKLNSHL